HRLPAHRRRLDHAAHHDREHYGDLRRDRSPQLKRGAERGLDLYETPEAATRALLHVEQFRGPIWEPACGRGAIARVLRTAGHRVVATDIEADAYGCPDATGGIDFLRSWTNSTRCRTLCAMRLWRTLLRLIPI